MPTRCATRIFWPVLALVSFALHFAWEYAQCEAFFVHGREPATLGAMLRATLGERLLTAIAWAGTAVAWDRDWPLHRWTPRVWLALAGLVVALSVAVELHALAMDWWRYTKRAPLLPLTLVSVLPLVLLFPLSFGLARTLALRATEASLSPKGASSWNG